MCYVTPYLVAVLIGAGWCLRSDVVTDLGLQATARELPLSVFESVVEIKDDNVSQPESARNVGGRAGGEAVGGTRARAP